MDENYSHSISTSINIEFPTYSYELEYCPVLYRRNQCRQCKTGLETYKRDSWGFFFEEGRFKYYIALIAKCPKCETLNTLRLELDPYG